MRRAIPAVLALAALPACLDPNPQFDGDGSTSLVDDAGSADDAGSSADESTEGECITAGLDTGDTGDIPTLEDGSYMFVLAEPSSAELFFVWYPDPGPGELHLQSDVAVDLCAYLDCPGADNPQCVPPAVFGADESGFPGCCGRTVLDLSFSCLESSAKMHARMSGAEAPCTRVNLEVAKAIP